MDEFPGLMAAGMTAIGRFGIGFFSVFMLGSEVRVYSRRCDRGVEIVTPRRSDTSSIAFRMSGAVGRTLSTFALKPLTVSDGTVWRRRASYVLRSGEGRVGTGWVSTGGSRWW